MANCSKSLNLLEGSWKGFGRLTEAKGKMKKEET